MRAIEVGERRGVMRLDSRMASNIDPIKGRSDSFGSMSPDEAENDCTTSQQQSPRSRGAATFSNLRSGSSLIDNTLAQIFSLRRAQSTPDIPSCATPATSTTSSPPRSAALGYKKSPSDGSLKKRAAKFSYAQKSQAPTTITIVSNARVRRQGSMTTSATGSSLSLGSDSSSDSSSSSSLKSSSKSVCSATPLVIATPNPLIQQAESDLDPYTFIETLTNQSTYDSSTALNDSNKSDTRRRTSIQPLHSDEFKKPTQEEIDAYSNDAIAAVRSCDVDSLRSIHESGRSLRCCNRFGESLLHVACRRSTPEIVKFLLKEAGVCPRIRDDYGRTPLHDAVWRAHPEVDIVELLLNVEPRLAFVEDVRGHKPFQYARKEHWRRWREFLCENRDLILTD